MDSLTQLTAKEATQIDGLLFDLDDTLLEAGQLQEAAYSSLFRLRDSGVRLFVLTGRPASWGALIAGMWPVEAAIVENGALAYARSGGRVCLVDAVSKEARAERRARLKQLVAQAQMEVPTLISADDVGGRVTDYTFDIGEHHIAKEVEIARVQHIASLHGARTTRSSVHLHVTFDRSDKATGALRFLSSRGFDTTLARTKFAFIGDGENDASCFAAFKMTVGVRNLRGHFSLTPRFRTEGRAADGFRQFADTLCRLRS